MMVALSSVILPRAVEEDGDSPSVVGGRRT